jgi:hypothetical protein
VAIRTLAEVASVLKTQAQVGLKPGRFGWEKAYRTGNLFNSVYVKIKSSKDVISGILTVKSDLFYSKFIIDGGYGKVKYKAGPRPYLEAAAQSPEYIKAVEEYIQSQFIPFIQKKFKKAQTDFNKVK